MYLEHIFESRVHQKFLPVMVSLAKVPVLGFSSDASCRWFLHFVITQKGFFSPALNLERSADAASA